MGDRPASFSVEEHVAIREAEAAVRAAFSELPTNRWFHLTLELFRRLAPDPLEVPDG